MVTDMTYNTPQFHGTNHIDVNYNLWLHADTHTAATSVYNRLTILQITKLSPPGRNVYKN